MDKERGKLGLSNQFEFAVYGELLNINNNDSQSSKDITKKISEQINEETHNVGWKDKKTSMKNMSIAISDILMENKVKILPERQINDLTQRIIELAKINL
jgi:hypothetical protein